MSNADAERVCLRFRILTNRTTMSMQCQVAKLMRKIEPTSLSRFHSVQEHKRYVTTPERECINGTSILSEGIYSNALSLKNMD